MHSHLGDAFFKHSDEYDTELTKLSQCLNVLQKRVKKEANVVNANNAFESLGFKVQGSGFRV